MSTNQRLISTIIATHNRPELIVRTLDSLMAQTYRPLEIIVVDDGSDVAIGKHIRAWKARVRPDIDFTYIWQQNRGPAAARNKGAACSAGDFIHFLDDDDLLAPDALQQLAASLKYKRLGIAMAAYRYWSGGTPYGPVSLPKAQRPEAVLHDMIAGSWFVPIHGYLFTRKAWQKTGQWHTGLSSQEDDELLLRAALARIPMVPALAAQVYYCQHEGVRRATPGKPGESVEQGLRKRLHADLAIREFVFDQSPTPHKHVQAFLAWERRLTARYGDLLNEVQGHRLLNWLRYAQHYTRAVERKGVLLTMPNKTLSSDGLRPA